MPTKAIIVDTSTGDVHEGEVGCDRCGMLACVCTIMRRHESNCKFLRAATCTVGIECEHGYDVCPKCDPCECGAGIATEDFGDA